MRRVYSAPQLLGAAAPSCQHRECTRSCRCVAAQALDRFHQLQPSSSDSRSHVPKKGSQLMCIRRTQKRFRVRLIALALKVSCAPDCTCLESLGVACFNSLAHWRFLGSRLPGADRSLLSRVGLGMADASRTISQCQVGESILIPRPVWLSPLSGACDLCRCFRAEATRSLDYWMSGRHCQRAAGSQMHWNWLGPGTCKRKELIYRLLHL